MLRPRTVDLYRRLQTAAAALAEKGILAGGLRVPNAAAPIEVTAEPSESRPSRYEVALRAWTRWPRPRAGSYEKDGQE